MATSNNTKLQLSSLDFDSIKNNLKTYLQGQTQFSDYNFEGSAINTLLDVLAYNTHYNGFYLNMCANEMFLDTAVLRSTVVSHAKALGYTPLSVVSAEAVVNVAITKQITDPTTQLTLPRFTTFVSNDLNGQSYNFVTLDDVNSTAVAGVFNYNNLVIKEGNPAIRSFVVDSSSNPDQTFNLQDSNIDTSTLQVIVQDSFQNSKVTPFILCEDAAAVSNTSPVYFLEEGDNGTYVIYFGDNVIGQQLIDGNIVIVSYLISSADAANYLNSFSLSSGIGISASNTNVTTVQNSGGGTPIEDVASIKYSAPKSFVAQNRAVTVNDYIALINKKYPYFDAVTVWGGETLSPPVYGKVYVSAKPKNGYAVTTQQQQFLIQNIIKPISVLTVTPEFVPADYNFLLLNLTVEYDSKQTTLSAQQISNLVEGAVLNYAAMNLNTFNSEFRLSRLLRAIDDSEGSILSSTASVIIQKRLIPNFTIAENYTLKVGFGLEHGDALRKLTSSPSFSIADSDSGGLIRQGFIEEVPNSFSGINNIEVNFAGSGYTTVPSITITGDGTGANAYPIVVNGKIQSIIVDNAGSEYTSASATVSGTVGTGALLTVILQGKLGVLRTYFYDNTNNKVILNPNAGTIDYDNGIITLVSFAPTGIEGTNGVLYIQAPPESTSFGSNNERIITLDPTDPNAITVNMIDVNNK